MSLIASQIDVLKGWASPRRATHRGGECPFLLSSTLLEGPASKEELVDTRFDDGLREFWMHAGSADLFKDEKYGQWGLRILSPRSSERTTEEQLSARPSDFISTDLVIGSFYGDSDLLVMDTGRCINNECPILVALPLDLRIDWPKIAGSFSEFLEAYVAAEGDKYWEVAA